MFALIHSPLAGPSTWKLVAAALKRQGCSTIVPDLSDHASDPRPFWEQHAESAAAGIRDSAPGERAVLVGHSGAGPLLPAIAARLDAIPAATIYVDAGLPASGANRIELMDLEGGDWAGRLRRHLEQGRRFPEWTDDSLAEVVPDPAMRRLVLDEMRPRGADFFLEPVGAPRGWEQAPAGYLLFTETYTVQADRAASLGWPVIHLPAGHFHMLVNPEAVADQLQVIAGMLA